MSLLVYAVGPVEKQGENNNNNNNNNNNKYSGNYYLTMSPAWRKQKLDITKYVNWPQCEKKDTRIVDSMSLYLHDLLK